jgi:hypothetical protein
MHKGLKDGILLIIIKITNIIIFFWGNVYYVRNKLG